MISKRASGAAPGGRITEIVVWRPCRRLLTEPAGSRRYRPDSTREPEKPPDLLQRRVPAPGIERVVDHHAVPQHFVVIREVERQALGDGQQAGGLLCQMRRAAVGAAHDQGELQECGVGQTVLVYEGVEAALIAVVATVVSIFHAGHVIRCGAGGRRDLHDFAARHIEKLRAFVDEAGDQPGAGDAVDLGPLAGNPFHSPTLIFQPPRRPSPSSPRCRLR